MLLRGKHCFESIPPLALFGIADEPVSMVDASLRISIVNLFRQLRDQRGVSVVYITHDLATAYYVSDHIAIMFRGNIVEMGTSEILVRPKHPYTKTLIQSILKPEFKSEGDMAVRLLEEQEEYRRQGCKFAGRCPEVMEICRHVFPKETRFDDGTVVRCHQYE